MLQVSGENRGINVSNHFQAHVFSLFSALNRLWETLNFTKAGLIPNAGRLKRKDGQGEEYVDALVFYKSFVKD